MSGTVQGRLIEVNKILASELEAEKLVEITEIGIRLKKKTEARAYEFSGGTGIVFLDIVKITDLLPERNSMYFPPLDFLISNFDQSREHRSIWIFL